ncbi:MAG: cell division protein FtsZ, partial [Pseudomonadota bacterium]
MTIKLELPKLTDMTPRILVIGVGGAGGNAINNMIASGLKGVDFVAANTDAQALSMSSAERRLQLGVNLTEGLGAGANPQIGQAAAEEALEDIRSELSGAHMVFIAAGMGGGTGTGAAAVIARCAREMGILAVGIVSKPFHFEGTRRMRIAEAGIDELRAAVDTLIVIPNQNLFSIANERTTFAESFVLADQVLYSGIACIVDLILKDGLINLDFADVRAVMADMGGAVMGTGEAEGSQRAVMAAEEAIANPLLEDVALSDAQGVLISIVGGPDMTLYEVDEAANRIRQEVDGDANIIVGATFDSAFEDRLRVSLVAAGMDRDREAFAVDHRAPAASVHETPAAAHTPTDAAPDANGAAVTSTRGEADGVKPITALPPPLPGRSLTGAGASPVPPPSPPAATSPSAAG